MIYEIAVVILLCLIWDILYTMQKNMNKYLISIGFTEGK